MLFFFTICFNRVINIGICVVVCECVCICLKSCERVWMSVFFCFGFCYSQVQCEFHISTAYFRYISTAQLPFILCWLCIKKLPIESFHQRRRNQRKVYAVGMWERRKKCTRALLQLSFLQTTGGLSVWLSNDWSCCYLTFRLRVSVFF